MKSQLLCIGVGVGIGYVAAITHLKKVYAKMLEEEVRFQVDEELAKTKELFLEAEAERDQVKKDEIDQEAERIFAQAAEAGGAMVNYQNYMPEEDRLKLAVEEGKVDDPAHTITFEVYSEEDVSREKRYLQFFLGDSTLADVNDDKVEEDWVDILKSVIYTAHEEDATADAFYVRVERYRIDFEVHMNPASYSVFVLGEA